jgi:hypothetical protein
VRDEKTSRMKNFYSFKLNDLIVKQSTEMSGNNVRLFCVLDAGDQGAVLNGVETDRYI